MSTLALILQTYVLIKKKLGWIPLFFLLQLPSLLSVNLKNNIYLISICELDQLYFF